MNKPVAIYARVSSDRQKENQTVASQTAAPLPAGGKLAANHNETMLEDMV